jgi:hypothetical protein
MEHVLHEAETCGSLCLHPLTLRQCETHPGDGTCAVVKEELWQQESLIFFAQRKSLTIAERRVRRRQLII